MSAKERTNRPTRVGALAALVALAFAVGAPAASAHDAAAQLAELNCAGDFDEESVRIENFGDHDVSLRGWMLESEGQSREGPQRPFFFPVGITLAPGESVTMHTGVGEDDTEGPEMHVFWGRSAAVWNDEGDTATLVNDNDEVVDEEGCFAAVDTSPGAEPVDMPDDGETPEAVCVENLVAVAHADRSIELSWDAVEGATVYHVHAVVDGEVGDLVALVEPDATSFVHEDLEVGQTYGYAVAANWHPHGCEMVFATAIPVFPSALAVALGAVGAVGAVLLARRR